MTTILVVDESSIIREPIELALQTQGYQTLGASNGQEAIDVVLKQLPNLILLEVCLPVMDGIEFLKELRNSMNLRKLPVIILTATSDRQCVIDAARLGIKSYMLKTQFSMSELMSRIKKCLCPDGQAKSIENHAAGDTKDVDDTVGDLEICAGYGYDLGKMDKISDQIETLRTLKPLMSKSDVFAKLEECSDLQAFSPTATRLLKLINNDESSVEKIAKVIKQDHAIAIKVLKLANSPVYSRGEPIETIEMAVPRIGLRQMHQTVLNIGVIEQLGEISIGEHVDAGQFWEHGIACGIIASEIANELKEVEVDAAFTMGLVHDVGRLMYAKQFENEFSEALQVAERLQLPLEQVESRLFLVNHADSMDRLLHMWKFPKRLIDPIVYHHLSIGNIRRMAPRRINEVATLALADRLAHALMIGSSGNDTIYPIKEFMKTLDLDRSIIARIEQNVPEQTENLKLALLAESNYTVWSDTHARYIGMLEAPFHPLLVTENPEIDALSLFCNKLQDPEEQPPNIAIVHLGNSRERVKLTEKLNKSEAKLGVSKLPVLVVSSDGSIRLEEKEMNQRPHVLLPLPFTVSRFVQSYNALIRQTVLSCVA